MPLPDARSKTLLKPGIHSFSITMLLAISQVLGLIAKSRTELQSLIALCMLAIHVVIQ